ncbi:hypothetical protein PMZ80_008030 [Knufia obscura]|uniref:AMMECR1 domain-containing protein n=1 Tax=Knufia obscura TaxID=1635080 RepID=A0ABR0RGA3_9EURO|nr:hypothetical protein PMZ80_008030 [Knufia obscura]
MASPAHGFYCFEVLAASYGQLQHPDLQTILESYEQWLKELNRELIEEEAVQDEPVVQTSQQSLPQFQPPQGSPGTGQLQLPPISRLLDSATPSSQSTVSTPSSASVNSSITQLTSTTSVDEIAPPTYASRLSVTESYPMFVTWNTLSRSGHKSLRGCIGTFEPLPLEKGLETYALTSAFDDTRFSPIPADLLPRLSCSLTLLADFEECAGPMDWELGKHGIRISFTHRYRRYGATYLPDVAVEQGWTQEETLESLMRKAGWDSSSRRFGRGSSRPWEELRDFRVVRYTGLKASASYSDWQEWQKWARVKQPELWS